MIYVYKYNILEREINEANKKEITEGDVYYIVKKRSDDFMIDDLLSMLCKKDIDCGYMCINNILDVDTEEDYNKIHDCYFLFNPKDTLRIMDKGIIKCILSTIFKEYKITLKEEMEENLKRDYGSLDVFLDNLEDRCRFDLTESYSGDLKFEEENEITFSFSDTDLYLGDLEELKKETVSYKLQEQAEKEKEKLEMEKTIEDLKRENETLKKIIEELKNGRQ